jgi:hypothetical protein
VRLMTKNRFRCRTCLGARGLCSDVLRTLTKEIQFVSFEKIRGKDSALHKRTMDALAKHIKLVRQDQSGRSRILVNRCCCSTKNSTINGGAAAETAATPSSTVTCSSSIRASLVQQSETLVTLLLVVLSDGLWPGLDLWSVLVTLERCQNLPTPMSIHFRFAVQMVLLIRTSFSTASEAVKSRAFIRCALNQGCLLAALEVLGRQFQPILEGYMMDHALLRQYGTDRWDRLVRVVAPIAGPPLDVFFTVASSSNSSNPKGSNNSAMGGSSPSSGPSAGVAFDLDLVVPEFDYSKEYMSSVKLYIAGVTDSAAIPQLPIEVVEEVEEVATEIESQRSVTHDESDDGRASSVERATTDDIETRQQLTSTPLSTPLSPEIHAPDQFPAAEGGGGDASSSLSAPATKKKTVKKVTVVTKRIIRKSGGAAGGEGASTVVTTTTTRTKSLPPPSGAADADDDHNKREEVVDEVITAPGASAVIGEEAEELKHVDPTIPCDDVEVAVVAPGTLGGNGAAAVDPDGRSSAPDRHMDAAMADLSPQDRTLLLPRHEAAVVATATVIGISEAEKLKRRKEFDDAMAAVERLFARRRAALDAAFETVVSAEVFLDKELNA